MPPYRLGRRPQPDARNLNYPLRALLPERIVRTTKVWAQGMVLDQGDLGSCVGNAWVDYCAAEPAPRLEAAKDTETFAVDWYSRATQVDAFPGGYYAPGWEDTGSSTLAGAKVGQSLGYVVSYHWAADVDDIIDALVAYGPVVVGSKWLNSMFDPDGEGFLTCDGDDIGGHDYLVRGVIFGRTFETGPRDVFVIQNSWGPAWGDEGCAYIAIDDFTTLWADQGDACIAVKGTGVPTPAPEPESPPFPGCLSLNSLRTFVRRLRARIARRPSG